MIGFPFALWKSMKTGWVHPYLLWGLMDLVVEGVLIMLLLGK